MRDTSFFALLSFRLISLYPCREPLRSFLTGSPLLIRRPHLKRTTSASLVKVLKWTRPSDIRQWCKWDWGSRYDAHIRSSKHINK